MNSKELRIGNLVYQGKRYGIAEISAYQIHQLTLKEHGNQVADYYHEFAPIPLTEEWILKFGFHEDTEWKSRVLWTNPNHKQERKQYWHSEGQLMLFCNSPDKGYQIKDTHMRCWINYVHELQNLYFFLCYEELKLK